MDTFRQFLGNGSVKDAPFIDDEGNFLVQSGDTVRWSNEAGEQLAGKITDIDTDNKIASIDLYDGEKEKLSLEG